jgi:glucose-6-phosphate isomerase
MAGARQALQTLGVSDANNDACRWAAVRNILYRKGKSIEVLACYEPDFALMNEWYKQLFGESEGKDQKGIFPASVIFTTDLHSMGQFLQDGSRSLFETVVAVKTPRANLTIGRDAADFDGLNYLEGKTLAQVNKSAMQGTILAHTDGGVPVVVLQTDSLSEQDLGYLVYFFEMACAVSGYLMGVNPFNQPGVESYQKNMFALLGKPGLEEQAARLAARLNS